MDKRLQDDISYGSVDGDLADALARHPVEEDGPVWMINLMKYRERAEYRDGRETTLSGQQADDLYAPFRVFREFGAQIVFVSEVEEQLVGDDVEWDRVAVVRYPSRRSFAEMQDRKDYQELHVHKEAGMEQTIIIVGTPLDLSMFDAEPIGELLHPPTEDDPRCVVMHVLRFAPEGRDDARSEEHRTMGGLVNPKKGATPLAWFEAEGTIIGDGRSWDDVRFNVYPSRAAFMDIVFDSDRLGGERGRTEPQIEDSYALLLRPFLDGLAESIVR